METSAWFVDTDICLHVQFIYLRDKERQICKCLQLNYHKYDEHVMEDNKTVTTYQLRSEL